MRAVLATVVAMTATSCSPTPDQQYLAACETAIKAGLVAPSGYRRIDDVGVANRIEMPSAALSQLATRAGLKLSSADLNALGEPNGPTPAVYQRLIEYDAPNAYNAPIRSNAWCFFFSIDGKPDSISQSRIAVVDRKDLSSVLKP